MDNKPPRNYHRPISITIETVRRMPEERYLPQETQMFANLKGNRKQGFLLVEETLSQLVDKDTLLSVRQILEKVNPETSSDFFAVEITGPS